MPDGSVPATAGQTIALSRLYRAHIEPHRWPSSPERTVFIEASSHRAAIERIAAAIAALEMRKPEEVQDRIYNCRSAAECIEMGESEDIELRLFEVGWGREILFVKQPLFLVNEPGALARKWAQTMEGRSCALILALATIAALCLSGCASGGLYVESGARWTDSEYVEIDPARNYEVVAVGMNPFGRAAIGYELELSPRWRAGLDISHTSSLRTGRDRGVNAVSATVRWYPFRAREVSSR